MRNRLHLLSLGTMVMFVACPTPTIAAADRCEPQVAKIVSVQGRVEAQRASEVQWQPAGLNDTYCPGDTIRVQERSRASLVLTNDTVLRLDQNTTVTFPEPEEKEISLLHLLTGAIHFFSRVPRTLKVNTPFVNAAVEGTEFFIRVKKAQAILTVFEGEVATSNEAGRLVLRSGESAVAMAGEAPKARVVVRPRDVVQWALYYPAIVDYRPVDFAEADWQGMVRRSIKAYRQGDLASAFSSIAEAPENIDDPRFFTYRAALLLTVGRVDEAATDIEKVLSLAPQNGLAVALQSIIAVVQNRKDEALELAQEAVKLASESVAARVALSYAQQAGFDLQAALASLQDAVKLRPDNALAWARLSELRLSVGDLDKALEAANQAVSLNPNVARTQTVRGFALLTQIKIGDATEAFEKAIVLDQAAPLPRLGLGLAKIRQGDLEAGRREIEIAVSLDPNNSLIRSYLGKAYYEEKRDKLAASQYATAKELDPLDPTPWFYDAIRKQTINRPVEALHDLQKSVELNDNRAVYRSRLLLDGDLAARSASLGRIYRDLGFEQLALVEGWKSVNTDPSDYSGHRFLADTYSTLPRHEIARVSELLQSQLLQPINVTPLQPQLAESNLLILEGAGPANPSFNEFNPLFTRNRLDLQLSALDGNNDTTGNEWVQSGLFGIFSYSLGQFHYETDGFRDNNDLTQDIENAFVQLSPTPRINLQAEYRHTETDHGDLTLDFDPTIFDDLFRREEKVYTRRLGANIGITASSNLILSRIEQDSLETQGGFFTADLDSDGDITELLYLFQLGSSHIALGMGRVELDPVLTSLFFPTEQFEVRHKNAYVYTVNHPTSDLTWTVGLSDNSLQDSFLGDFDETNPKLGLMWDVTANTRLRAAAFQVLTRSLINDQTLEPTQVAGFNQFFDEPAGTTSKRYGIALDHKFSSSLYAGLELSRRDLRVPLVVVQTEIEDWREDLYRAYINWTPHSSVSVAVDYEYEDFDRTEVTGTNPNPPDTRTQVLPVSLSYYGPSGLFAQLRATHVDQEVELFTGPERDSFVLTDLSLGFRLPKRYGLITLEVKNLFEKEFNYHDLGNRTQQGKLSRFVPERTVFAKITLAL